MSHMLEQIIYELIFRIQKTLLVLLHLYIAKGTGDFDDSVSGFENKIKWRQSSGMRF